MTTYASARDTLSVVAPGDYLPLSDDAPEGAEPTPKEGARVYLVKVPRGRDKIKLRHAIRAAGGQVHGMVALMARLRGVIVESFPDDADPARDRALAVLDEADAVRIELLSLPDDLRAELALLGNQARRGELSADEIAAAVRKAAGDLVDRVVAAQQALGDLERTIARSDPVYAGMAADNVTYTDIYNWEAARLFLTGWENGPLKKVDKVDADGKPVLGDDGRVETEWVPATFTRGPDGVPDALLDLISDLDLAAIGNAVWQVLEGPDKDEAKNSGSGSSAASTPTSSSASNPTAPATPRPKKKPSGSPTSDGATTTEPAA